MEFLIPDYEGHSNILPFIFSAPPNNVQTNITAPTIVRTLSQPVPQLPQTPHPPPINDTAINASNASNATTAEDNNGNGGEQEMAISAIMQSLIKDSAQFEEEHRYDFI